MAGELALTTEQFVDVTVSSTAPSNRMPTLVSLKMGYYQVDAKVKKLISARVEFSGWVAATNNKEQAYIAKISYLPLSHTELMIAFALPSYVYITMYVLVGCLCIFMVLLFAIYTKLTSRRKNARLVVWAYVTSYFTPNLQGLLYCGLPQLLYFLVLAVGYRLKLMYLYRQPGDSTSTVSSVRAETPPVLIRHSGTESPSASFLSWSLK